MKLRLSIALIVSSSAISTACSTEHTRSYSIVDTDAVEVIRSMSNEEEVRVGRLSEFLDLSNAMVAPSITPMTFVLAAKENAPDQLEGASIIVSGDMAMNDIVRRLDLRFSLVSPCIPIVRIADSLDLTIQPPDPTHAVQFDNIPKVAKGVVRGNRVIATSEGSTDNRCIRTVAIFYDGS